MSGTSLDGVDAALLVSDGEAIGETGPWLSDAYDEPLRAALRAALAGQGDIEQTEKTMTEAHARAAGRLLAEAGLTARDIAVVGFPGQTLSHRPAEGITRQIGDGARLANLLGIDVVNDFRRADVAAGGQGAPLAPLYHAALGRDLTPPLAVLNLGGVGNLTWLGAPRPDGTPALLAFDTGPGCALIDDWLLAHSGRAYDDGGKLAAAGTVRDDLLAGLLGHPFFALPPPKSLDRNAFDPAPLAGLSAADGAATLTAFTAAAVHRALAHLPAPPGRWLVTGGGRHNRTLMAQLKARLQATVEPVERAGWQGDALEAQAFAFLAVRALRGLPLSLPSTTGVPRPLTGGALHRGGAEKA